jgi:hypothetical protein
MSNLYRGLSMDASYQVSVHLAERFQRRRLQCEKLTDDRCKVMAKGELKRATSGAVYDKGLHREQYDTIKGYIGGSMIQ